MSSSRPLGTAWPPALLLAALLPLSAERLATTTTHGPLAVVVHPDVPLEDVSRRDLRAIVTGQERFWSRSRTRIYLALPEQECPGYPAVLGGFFEGRESAFRSHWIRLKSQNRGSPPVPFCDTGEALDFVSRRPGALALVASPLEPGEGVRILPVEGKRPGEAGYPLSAD